jgi:hypothetical protein
LDSGKLWDSRTFIVQQTGFGLGPLPSLPIDSYFDERLTLESTGDLPYRRSQLRTTENHLTHDFSQRRHNIPIPIASLGKPLNAIIKT